VWHSTEDIQAEILEILSIARIEVKVRRGSRHPSKQCTVVHSTIGTRVAMGVPILPSAKDPITLADHLDANSTRVKMELRRMLPRGFETGEA